MLLTWYRAGCTPHHPHTAKFTYGARAGPGVNGARTCGQARPWGNANRGEKPLMRGAVLRSGAAVAGRVEGNTVHGRQLSAGEAASHSTRPAVRPSAKWLWPPEDGVDSSTARPRRSPLAAGRPGVESGASSVVERRASSVEPGYGLGHILCASPARAPERALKLPATAQEGRRGPTPVAHCSATVRPNAASSPRTEAKRVCACVGYKVTPESLRCEALALCITCAALEHPGPAPKGSGNRPLPFFPV